MPHHQLNRRVRRLAATTGVLSVVSALLVAVPARADTARTRTVEYGGVSLEVPAAWPVVDLATDPDACVRFDREAVYLGEPASDQRCPAHAVGRADTVWITAAEDGTVGDGTAGEETRRSAQVRTTRSPRDGETLTRVLGSLRSTHKVQVRSLDEPSAAVAGRDEAGRAASRRVARSALPALAALNAAPANAVPTVMTAAPAVVTAAPAAANAVPTLVTAAPAAVTAAPAAASAAPVQAALPSASVANSGRQLTGMAFDTCAAPSAETMKAWRASPYAAVGIYIGGSMRACPDGNLSAAWVADAKAQGWGFLPIWVGPQAPCVVQGNLALIPKGGTEARALGTSNAGEAVTKAQALGLPKGSVIYYDMEGYKTNDPACSAAVIAFLDAWSTELNRLGYVSGAYGGSSSLMRDLSQEVASGRAFTAPHQIWVAHWNHLQITTDPSTPQYYPDSLWQNHQRLHQYWGDHVETWGGKQVHIDSNWVDAVIPGAPTQQSYGTLTVGPGSAGFTFGGDMRYWKPDATLGQRQLAHSTGNSSTGTEQNHATWQVSLPAGRYAVEAYVPKAEGAGLGRYTVSSGSQSSVLTLDQSTGTGWRALGQVTLAAAGKAAVRLGDNGATSKTARVWADAVRWRKLESAWERIAGRDRYETSARISELGFPSADEVFVASGMDHADALSAGSLAGQRSAPLLLTRPDVLSPSVRDELARLRPARTYVVGGTGAISAAVAKQIATATGGTVERLSGKDRFATSARLTTRLLPEASTLYLASGLGFADGAAGGAAAAREKAPVLLTGRTGLTPAVADLVAELQPTKVVILGGSAAVPSSVEARLRGLAPGVKIERHAGADRYATAALAARSLWSGSQVPATLFVTGLAFPDALSATPLAVVRGGPVLLTTARCQPAPTHDAVQVLQPRLSSAIGSSTVTAAANTRC